LYVSLGPGAIPTTTSFAYSATTLGLDTVTINANDSQVASGCPATGTGCVVTVGVFGFTTSNYTIALTSNGAWHAGGRGGGVSRVLATLPLLIAVAQLASRC
jgi:hypothetical protein